MSTRQTYFWDKYVNQEGQWRGDSRPLGEDLSKLRRGLGREPGTVAEMWRFHQVEVPDDLARRGLVSSHYEAEHHALTLFAVHQQSAGPTAAPVHKPKVGVGAAIRALHAGRGGEGAEASKAIDRRFYAAVTATTRAEAAHHLRGLIRMLRSRTNSVPLDYTQLVKDLWAWDQPQRRDRVRRAWGLQYNSVPIEGPPAAEQYDGASTNDSATGTTLIKEQ